MSRNTNTYEICGDETLIHLRCGKICRISTPYINLVSHYTWCVEGTGYVMSRTTGEAVKIHRVITGANRGDFVDHIDGDPLNNTISNLRICSKQQNEFNTKLRSNNRTGYKGVSFVKKAGLYRAYINRDGKQYNLGLFESKESAARAYNRAAVSLFGEFARINANIA